MIRSYKYSQQSKLMTLIILLMSPSATGFVWGNLKLRAYSPCLVWGNLKLRADVSRCVGQTILLQSRRRIKVASFSCKARMPKSEKEPQDTVPPLAFPYMRTLQCKDDYRTHSPPADDVSVCFSCTSTCTACFWIFRRRELYGVLSVGSTVKTLVA